MKRWRFLGVLTLGLLLAGCGTRSSSEPIYPPEWPAIVKGTGPARPIDLAGVYRAVSDPVGPMAYEAGGGPREELFFVPVSGEHEAPRVGRRVLPWHLAGLNNSRIEDRDPWVKLTAFAAALQPDAAHPDGLEDRGWVRVAPTPRGELWMECGVGPIGSPPIATVVVPRSNNAGWIGDMFELRRGWTEEGGLVVVCGAFPLSPVEQGGTARESAAGFFGFARATDGSLVMRENLYGAPGMSGETMSFQKWWRWRRIDAP